VFQCLEGQATFNPFRSVERREIAGLAQQMRSGDQLPKSTGQGIQQPEVAEVVALGPFVVENPLGIHLADQIENQKVRVEKYTLCPVLLDQRTRVKHCVRLIPGSSWRALLPFLS
jgi:hypothetical protein